MKNHRTEEEFKTLYEPYINKTDVILRSAYMDTFQKLTRKKQSRYHKVVNI